MCPPCLRPLNRVRAPRPPPPPPPPPISHTKLDCQNLSSAPIALRSSSSPYEKGDAREAAAARARRGPRSIGGRSPLGNAGAPADASMIKKGKMQRKENGKTRRWGNGTRGGEKRHPRRKRAHAACLVPAKRRSPRQENETGPRTRRLHGCAEGQALAMTLLTCFVCSFCVSFFA